MLAGQPKNRRFGSAWKNDILCYDEVHFGGKVIVQVVGIEFAFVLQTIGIEIEWLTVIGDLLDYWLINLLREREKYLPRLPAGVCECLQDVSGGRLGTGLPGERGESVGEEAVFQIWNISDELVFEDDVLSGQHLFWVTLLGNSQSFQLRLHQQHNTSICLLFCYVNSSACSRSFIATLSSMLCLERACIISLIPALTPKWVCFLPFVSAYWVLPATSDFDLLDLDVPLQLSLSIPVGCPNAGDLDCFDYEVILQQMIVVSGYLIEVEVSTCHKWVAAYDADP